MEARVEPKAFKFFPVERMYDDFPWQIWLVGWLAIFKAFLWLAYEPNLSVATLRLLGYKFSLEMLPSLLLGICVWNLRRWAVWGIALISAANIVFFILNSQVLSGLVVHSEVFIYAVLMSLIVLVCNGPIGDIFILIASPSMLKVTRKG